MEQNNIVQNNIEQNNIEQNNDFNDQYRIIGRFPDLLKDNIICNIYLHKKTKQTIIRYTYLDK
jgi:hypothetical protein